MRSPTFTAVILFWENPMTDIKSKQIVIIFFITWYLFPKIFSVRPSFPNRFFDVWIHFWSSYCFHFLAVILKLPSKSLRQHTYLNHLSEVWCIIEIWTRQCVIPDGIQPLFHGLFFFYPRNGLCRWILQKLLPLFIWNKQFGGVRATIGDECLFLHDQLFGKCQFRLR